MKRDAATVVVMFAPITNSTKRHSHNSQKLIANLTVSFDIVFHA